MGAYASTFAVRKDYHNSGLAVSPDGSAIVVSNEESNTISVFRLPDGAFQNEFGGAGSAPGQFNRPRKICFSPVRNGNILVADFANNRVQVCHQFFRIANTFFADCFPQEMTLAGAHVRTLADETLERVSGIAANTEVIVASSLRSGNQVALFDMNTGGLIRSFGKKGGSEGELNGSVGVRLTPDGLHLLIAEFYSNRLSVFTLTGDFVRCIGVGHGVLRNPVDVDFGPSGDILVANWENHRICVFSPDGSSFLQTFGTFGKAPGQFKNPRSLAMHSGQLYVSDYNTSRVQLFSPVSH